ncbi:unnamed protein product [Linum trigynum]|uniref:CCHC-type domain-containing protein n=1 Tax=Linum trigynum TaxID=586398 RepID=A0AAV2EWQ1_9ROSI
MFKGFHEIDMRGLNPERYMEFIRVFVQADSTRPLPPGSYFHTNGKREWLGFRYENLYVLCYYCGRLGHGKQECPWRKANEEARVAGPPEGRFTPWMKAGTNAPMPPPPRGRIIQQSPGDAGSSTNSPGFTQNQIWVAGGGSPATGSINPGISSTPSSQRSDGVLELAVQGPPRFTPHPFPTDTSSPNPRSVSGPSCQQLQHPHSEANYMLYGALPSRSPQFDKGCHFPNNIARNLSAEMEAEAWAHAYAQQPNPAY